MIGASAALLLARVPFLGPVGSIRLGRVDGKLIAFPTAEELENSDLDLIVVEHRKSRGHDRGVRRGIARGRDGATPSWKPTASTKS